MQSIQNINLKNVFLLYVVQLKISIIEIANTMTNDFCFVKRTKLVSIFRLNISVKQRLRSQIYASVSTSDWFNFNVTFLR